MPFLKTDFSSASLASDFPDTEDNSPSFFSETLPAAFRMENTIGAAVSNNTIPRDDYVDLDFDLVDHIPKEYEDRAMAYTFANNPEQINSITEQLQREDRDRAILSDAGGLGVMAQIGAGVFDPINLLPVGGAAYRSARVGNSFLKGAMVTGQAGFLSSTAAEAALHANQLSRTYGESAMNIGAGTLLAGVLGGSLSFVSKSVGDRGMSKLVDMMDKDMSSGGGGSGGAASVRQLPPEVMTNIEKEAADQVEKGLITKDQEQMFIGKRIEEEQLNMETVDTNKAMEGALKVAGKTQPVIRTQRSGVRETAEVSQRLSEGMMTTKNKYGVAAPENVERNIRNHDAKMYKALSSLDEQYAAYAGTAGKAFQVTRAAFPTAVKSMAGVDKTARRLTYKEFRVEVGKAMRNGDTHSIKEVANAAKMMRKEVFDPLKDQAVKLGLFDEDIEASTAVSYLNRVYNVTELVRNPEPFIAKTADWLEGKQVEAGRRVDDFDSAVAKLQDDIASREQLIKASDDATDKVNIKSLKKEVKTLKKDLESAKKLNARDLDELNMTREDFESLAWEIHGRIVSTPDGRLPYDQTIMKDPTKGRGQKGKSGFSENIKARKFLIPDNDIEDYLESDIELLSRRYTRNMASDVEMKRLFPDDDLDLTNTLKEIETAWQKKSTTDPKWQEKMNADIRDISAMRDKLRGVYGLPDNPASWGHRTGRLLRQMNYIRLLGGMTLSAIPDLARPVMVHGFSRVYKDALKPMMTEFSTFAKAGAEIRDMGLAMDMLTNARAQSIADVTEDMLRSSIPERAIGAMSDTMGMVSLMAPWNTAMKQIAGVVSQGRIMRALADEAAGKISKKEAAYLRAAGIDTAMGRKILKQINEHGELSENGLSLPRWDKWADPDAKRIFQSATGRDVDRIIVTPSLDVPLWMGKNEVGRLLGQFKSFAMASTSRVMLTGLQQADMAALNGLWLSVALGSLTAAAKMGDAGRFDETKKWGADRWIAEGIDRSGVTGWMFEAHNMVERATRGNVGLTKLMGGGSMSRYASRNALGSALGPSFGLVQTLLGVSGSTAEAAFGDDRWRESDSRAVRRLLPYQNLLGFRQLVDAAEEGINSKIGAR